MCDCQNIKKSNWYATDSVITAMVDNFWVVDII